jgi:hypothetical protein
MRSLFLIALLALAACTQATAYRLDNRTFAIKGPGIPGGSDTPDRQMAERVCPRGYRVLQKQVLNNTPDGYSQEPGVFTNWTIRCL